MSDATSNPSLGSLPGRVISTPGGGYAPVPAPRPSVQETDSAQAVQRTTSELAAGLQDPTRDDALVEGCKGLGNLIKLRVHPGTPLREVPHPADADTQLISTAEFTVAALRAEPTAGDLVSVEPDELERRTRQLRRARDLHAALSPVVETLDLIIRNYEDGIDGDLRAVHRNLASLIDNHPRFAERFGPLRTWASRIGQRSAEARRKNALRDALRQETAPAPIALATPPQPTATATAAPVTPAPLPLAGTLTTPAAAPAPRASRRRTGRRRG